MRNDQEGKTTTRSIAHPRPTGTSTDCATHTTHVDGVWWLATAECYERRAKTVGSRQSRGSVCIKNTSQGVHDGRLGVERARNVGKFLYKRQRDYGCAQDQIIHAPSRLLHKPSPGTTASPQLHHANVSHYLWRNNLQDHSRLLLHQVRHIFQVFFHLASSPMKRCSRAALRFKVNLVFCQQFQRCQVSVPSRSVSRGNALCIRGVDIGPKRGQSRGGPLASRNESQR